jgi:hypothetical protein
MRLIVITSVLAGALVLLSGCAMSATNGSGYPYPFTTGIIDESRTSADAPAEFRERDLLPPCADVVLDQGTQIPDASVACVEKAGPEGAELAVVQPTIEGDPIVTFYRVGPGIDGMEIWDDATRDTFGGGWHRAVCSTVSVFTPDGCENQDF